MMKYYNTLKEEGYGGCELLPGRKGHPVECYKLDNSFLKIAPRIEHPQARLGFLHEAERITGRPARGPERLVTTRDEEGLIGLGIYDQYGRKTGYSLKKPTDGLECEFNILKKIKHLGFAPEPISYKRVASVDGLDPEISVTAKQLANADTLGIAYLEILEVGYLDATPLNKLVYKKEHDETILGYIKQLFDMNIVHGDIKEDNILISKDSVFLIDYNHSYEMRREVAAGTDFETSPDIAGNINEMNYTKLMETVKRY